MKIKSLLNHLSLCIVALALSLNAVAQCSAAFTSANGGSPGLYTFAASSASNASGSNYSWYVNQAYVGNGNSLSYQFFANGTYNVCLQVMDSLNNGGAPCYDIQCDTVNVSNINNNGSGCNAAYTTSADTSFLYHFDGSSSTYSPTASLTWTMNGQTIGTGPHLYYMFPGMGTYIVCLSILDPANSCSDTYCDSVVVTNGGSFGCQAFYTYTASGSLYSFYPLGNNTPSTTYNWTVASPQNSSMSYTGNPFIATFTANGFYTVCLTVIDSLNNCYNQYCNSIYVSDSVVNGCSATFYTNVNGNNATVGITSYDPMFNYASLSSVSWNFGDGTIITETAPNISVYQNHQYATSGVYTICMTATDSVNNCSNTSCDSVYVGNNTTSCNAYFVLWQDSLNTGAWYAFNLSSGGALNTNLNYLWDFGDGTTSTQQFPSHTYATLGHYTICLTVSDSVGCSDTYCDSSSVHKMLSSAGGMSSFSVINNATGIHTTKEVFSAISTYPNPVSDNVTVSITSEENSNISLAIYDMYGKLISGQKANVVKGNNKINLNTSELAQGVYFISITDSINKKASTVKIVK